MATTSTRLPTATGPHANQQVQGYATPQQDTLPQCATFLPRRVLPIVFLPGIMGSNLRLTSVERQQELGQSDNIAWRPDDIGVLNAYQHSNADARERQVRLDPSVTAVDIYDPSGPSNLSGDQRNKNVALAEGFQSPLLASDPPTAPNRRTAEQKARQRGWGEVFFKSYGALLQRLEMRLNGTFSEGKLVPAWNDVVGVDPAQWRADPTLPQQALTAAELKKVATGCWFPVFAFGYNWLQSNGDSAKVIARRINAVIDSFRAGGFECPKVIVVTHSMGGLLARALIHPGYGGLAEKVLGIVHGVMPAIGAPAAYKRMRAGFEDPGLLSTQAEASVIAKVLGNYGDEVTAVLANAPGGLELLPNAAYGNGWLRVEHRGQELAAWPKNGDPFEEIYNVRGKWWSLIREDWINPADDGVAGWPQTQELLSKAKQFHSNIVDTYHECSYAHYGADARRLSFARVRWQISDHCSDSRPWRDWPILRDSRQGELTLVQPSPGVANNAVAGSESAASAPKAVTATIMPAEAPGDQTVPIASADHQLRSNRFKGVFRQVGYEHQSSYKDANALACTLYSIVRIAQQARWEECS